MIGRTAGIRAMAVRFPANVRSNDYFRSKYPDRVAQVESSTLTKLWSANDSTPESLEFDEEMRPFMSDPFRGTRERRVLDPGAMPSSLELRAARDVIEAAHLVPEDIDLLIAGSFLPDRVGNGNAPFLARDLGLRGAAWNIESACSTTLPALEAACALVRAGSYKNILIVASCTYSRVNDDADTLSWFLGDGAGAWLISELEPGLGVLGTKIVHTGETCDAAWYEPTFTSDGVFKPMMRSAKHTGRLFRDTAKGTLLRCCNGAIEAAGVRKEDIALFAINTPTAWYARFGARVLGVDAARTIDLYPLFGNIGPALPMANLYYAAERGRIRAGDLVLVYCVGSVSTAGAAVLRWGDVALGPAPEKSPEERAMASAKSSGSAARALDVGAR